MGSLVKTWGNISNDDRIWQVTRFYSTDLMTMLAAMDKLMASTGKTFPDKQLYTPWEQEIETELTMVSPRTC